MTSDGERDRERLQNGKRKGVGNEFFILRFDPEVGHVNGGPSKAVLCFPALLTERATSKMFS